MDDDLEQMFRESLARHADEVDTTVEVPESGRSFPWRGALVAAVVVGVVTASAALLGDDERPGGGVTDPPVVAVPDGWRVEAWHGVQVSVPADWGWGGAPMASRLGRGGDDYVSCSHVMSGRGYVGRPIAQTDMCTTYDPDDPPRPETPYVWLGVPLEEGRVDLGDGWVQETVEVADEPITVASDDPQLRAQVLASAGPLRLADDGCEAELPGPPVPMVGTEGVSGEREGMTVCVYHRDGERVTLTYSTHVGSDAADRFLGPPYADTHATCDAEPDEWVVLLIPYADDFGGGTRAVARVVIGLGRCPYLMFHSGTRGPLEEPKVAPWAVDGIPATVHGPFSGEPWVYKYFIGPQG